jgi:hypothetical protein
MKKIFLPITFCLLAAATTFTSCKKTQDNTSNVKPSTTAQTARDVDDAANPANPFDEVGYQHNEGLQNTRSVWNTPGRTFESVYTGEVNYIHQNVDNNVVPPDMTYLQNLYTQVNGDAANNDVNFINSTQLSPLAKTYANQMFSAALNPDPNADYFGVKAAIIQVETTIINDQNLSQSEKQQLLTSASVLRHSMLYWLNESGGTNTPGSNPCACKLFKKIGQWLADNFDWKAALITDAGTALGGLVTGGVSLVGTLIDSAVAGFTP